MDPITENIIVKLGMPFVECVALSEVENEDLLRVKAKRGVAEYCWTLSSNFTLYVMQNYEDVEQITYVDADLYFYSDVTPIFEEMLNSSITIIEHRFTERLKDRIVNGRFCVEWNSFRRDEEGMACLKKWASQCIDWCFYRLENEKMGDQKYLDDWPNEYSSCHIIQHTGAGIAPWNYAQYNFTTNDKNEILVNDDKLIFYHFHQFQILSKIKFDRLSSFYTSECSEPNDIYERYEKALTDEINNVLILAPDFKYGFSKSYSITSRRFIQKHVPMWFKDFSRFFFRY